MLQWSSFLLLCLTYGFSSYFMAFSLASQSALTSRTRSFNAISTLLVRKCTSMDWFSSELDLDQSYLAFSRIIFLIRTSCSLSMGITSELQLCRKSPILRQYCWGGWLWCTFVLECLAWLWLHQCVCITAENKTLRSSKNKLWFSKNSNQFTHNKTNKMCRISKKNL